jgi:hypothetical protein
VQITHDKFSFTCFVSIVEGKRMMMEVLKLIEMAQTVWGKQELNANEASKQPTHLTPYFPTTQRRILHD